MRQDILVYLFKTTLPSFTRAMPSHSEAYYGIYLSYHCSTLYSLTPSLGGNFGSAGFCFLFTFRKFLATPRGGMFLIQTFPQSTIPLINSVD